MVLPYGCIDLIFRKDVLESRGITNEILNRYKPSSAHIDNNLILVACAMSHYEAEQEVNMLENKYNLTFIKDNKALDFVLVESFFGPTSKCDWIKINKLKEDLIINDKKYSKGTICYEFIN